MLERWDEHRAGGTPVLTCGQAPDTVRLRATPGQTATAARAGARGGWPALIRAGGHARASGGSAAGLRIS